MFVVFGFFPLCCSMASILATSTDVTVRILLLETCWLLFVIITSVHVTNNVRATYGSNSRSVDFFSYLVFCSVRVCWSWETVWMDVTMAATSCVVSVKHRLLLNTSQLTAKQGNSEIHDWLPDTDTMTSTVLFAEWLVCWKSPTPQSMIWHWR